MADRDDDDGQLDDPILRNSLCAQRHKCGEGGGGGVEQQSTDSDGQRIKALIEETHHEDRTFQMSTLTS